MDWHVAATPRARDARAEPARSNPAAARPRAGGRHRARRYSHDVKRREPDTESGPPCAAGSDPDRAPERPTPAGPPEVRVLPVLKGAFRAMYERTSRMLERHGLHFGQHYLLLELFREDGQTVGGLTERLGVEGPTVVRTVRRMEAAGFLRREPDPDDRRRVLVYLTERGRALEHVLPEELAEIDRAAVAGMSQPEVDALLDTLTRIRSNLS